MNLLSLNPTEAQQITDWRFTELVRAGYDELKAAQLASTDVDLHTACDLIAKGCPPELAMAILV
jgi:hypothetical protein